MTGESNICEAQSWGTRQIRHQASSIERADERADKESSEPSGKPSCMLPMSGRTISGGARAPRITWLYRSLEKRSRISRSSKFGMTAQAGAMSGSQVTPGSRRKSSETDFDGNFDRAMASAEKGQIEPHTRGLRAGGYACSGPVAGWCVNSVAVSSSRNWSLGITQLV